MARRPINNRNMRLFRSTFDSSPELRNMVRDAELTMDELIFELLDVVKTDVIRFLKGYTDKTVKGDYRAQFGPLFKGIKGPNRAKVEWKQFTRWWDKRRPMHPGGWGDITGDLRAKYTGEVTKNGTADYTLTLDNTSEHAPFVEAMEGLFVLSGVMDPGGVVDRSITRTFNFMSRQLTKGPRGGIKRSGPRTTVSNDNGAINVSENA